MSELAEAEREILRHARDQAMEGARQQILQAKVDEEFRKAEEYAARKIYWERNKGKKIRTALYWVFLILTSIMFMGIPLAIHLYVRYRRKRYA